MKRKKRGKKEKKERKEKEKKRKRIKTKAPEGMACKNGPLANNSHFANIRFFN